LDDIIGKNLWNIVPHYVDTEIFRHYQKAMTSGQPATFTTYLAEFSSWVETRLFPSPQGLTGYFRNVTAQLKAEANLKQTLRQLEQTTRELSRSNRELAEFAAVTSHDLKEPLKSINLWIDLSYQRTDENGRIECLKRASENARKCMSLIDALLEYSSVGKDHLSFKEVNCEAVIEIVKSNLTKAISESGATIVYTQLPRIYADEIQLSRLFQNLISNSIKYCNHDRKPRIEIKCQEYWDRFEFQLSDNGIGIDEKDLQNVFQLFCRSENSKIAAGNGIGLATVKKLVELHGGWISVESKLGKGSKFKFAIPKIDVENVKS
jgi:light-regulated signal transduction histidine kinase (bacteriophytochrome)